jgi:hypothetical protein
MKTGDRVKILSGRGIGHTGEIVGVNGSTLLVKTQSGGGMGAYARISVRKSAVELIPHAKPATSPRQGVYAAPAYKPAAFAVPRDGSDAASRLPSLCGGQLVYPRGLR